MDRFPFLSETKASVRRHKQLILICIWIINRKVTMLLFWWILVDDSCYIISTHTHTHTATFVTIMKHFLVLKSSRVD